MKLARMSNRGRVGWGVVVSEAKIVDLTATNFSIAPTLRGFLENEGEATAREAAKQWVSLPDDALVDMNEVHLLSPVTTDCNVVCVGKNYRDHAAETGSSLPKFPLFFMKASTALTGPYDPIRKPSWVQLLDYEVELGVVIGKKATEVAAENAFDYVFGYTIINDVSAREFQNRDRQWFRAKSMDSFAPCGPWIVTKDELTDPENRDIALRVDGETRQSANTRDLVFGVAELIEDLTRGVTLYPGDIIATGTPSGVAMGHHKYLPKQIAEGQWDEVKDLPETRDALAWYLAPGQVVESEIGGIGALRNPVIEKK